MYAVEHGNIDAAILLICSGANREAEDNHQISVNDYAIKFGYAFFLNYKMQALIH
jgi:hypothetical protein